MYVGIAGIREDGKIEGTCCCKNSIRQKSLIEQQHHKMARSNAPGPLRYVIHSTPMKTVS